MEGLIPLVYRAIKRSNTRRKYRSLSEAEGFPVLESKFNSHLYGSHSPEVAMTSFYDEPTSQHHRRSNSVHDFRVNFFSPQQERIRQVSITPRLGKEVGGFRSHRMLSCITGA